MQLRHVRHLVTVAELGSIARAAAHLRVAQPALSREIRQMEADLGVALVTRERRGIRLTRAGALIVAAAPALLSRLDNALLGAREADAGLRGIVRLGLGRLALDSAPVGHAIAAVRARYPGIQLEVIELLVTGHARALLSRACDVTVGAFVPETAGVQRAVLYEEPVDGVLLSALHPLARSPELRLNDLRDEIHLTLAEPVGRVASFSRVYEALTRAGFDAGGRVERHNSLESVYALVAAGRGWALASHSTRSNPPMGTTVVPLSNFSFAARVEVCWRARESSRSTVNVAKALMDGATVAGKRGRKGDESTSTAKRVRGSAAAAASTFKRGRVGDEGDANASAHGNGLPPTHRLEVQQLEALVAAVEEQSLSLAAGRLGITQSGVSRRLRTLEMEARCRLLERAPYGVGPTEAGRALYADARDILRDFHALIERAKELDVLPSNGTTWPESSESHLPGAATGDWPIAGVCRVGALPPELAGSVQIAALRRVVESMPRVRLELLEMLPDIQAAALLDRRIDVGISGMFAGLELDPALSSVMLTDDPVDCVMLPERHPLAERAWVTAADLAAEPFLFIPRARGTALVDAVMKGFAQINLVPRIEATFGGPRSIWRAVADGMGWTIGPRSQRPHPPPGLAAVPVEGLHIAWGTALLWRRDEDDAVVRGVLDVFRDTRNPEVAVVVATVRASLGPASVTAGT